MYILECLLTSHTISTIMTNKVYGSIYHLHSHIDALFIFWAKTMPWGLQKVHNTWPRFLYRDPERKCLRWKLSILIAVIIYKIDYMHEKWLVGNMNSILPAVFLENHIEISSWFFSFDFIFDFCDFKVFHYTPYYVFLGFQPIV